MSIRPSYGKRSVLQVLSDGMSQHPPTGTSCCEDAAQSAAEVDRLTRERDELQAKLDAAEQRPTLDREAVREIINTRLQSVGEFTRAGVVDAIVQLALVVPSWLGDIPEKPEVKRHANRYREIDGRIYPASNGAGYYRREAWAYLALAADIEAEEAETGDDEDKQAQELWASVPTHSEEAWDDLPEVKREGFRVAIRAGWSKGGAA